ncbi:MAG: TolC family protein [Deltaproteobacteria bacterium]|nr:TolC family protein [Deltaproteobacteria bacterium]
MSLNECIEIILANNPDLAMAKADIESKEAALQSSQKDLYPTLSAQYSYAHQPDQFFSPADLFTYGFKAEQPLYKGKALVTSVKQAELSLGTSRLALEQLVNNLVFEIYGRYYELLRAVKLEEEAQQSVLRLQSHLKDAKAFYDAGLIPKNDMLQSEVELAQGEQDMVDAENSTALSRSRLNVLMERAVDTLFAIEDSTEYAIQNINWDEVIAKARESRAEIAQAEMSVRIAENDIVLAKAPYLPAVTLSASYDWLGDDLGLSHEPGAPREMKTIMAVASWKLWTWRKDSDDVLAAGKNLRRVQKSVAKTVNEVTLDARNSFLRLEQAAKRIKVSEKAIEHAKENFRINQAQYQAQLTTSTDVLDAQTLLSQAMTNYYDALYGYQLALAAIDKSKGLFGQLYVK